MTRATTTREGGSRASIPTFDFDAFVRAFDGERSARGLSWYEFADELWDQSAELNARRPDDHCLCGGAISRLGTRGATSCQYALFLLRWLGRAPEDFIPGALDVGDTRLPDAGEDARLRWDLSELHAALNDRRQHLGRTWADLADELGCTPSRLTNLRTARLADMQLAMRITQWLRLPAAHFIHPAEW